MGSKHMYVCMTCGYEALTSAGMDRGFRLVTNTFVCTDCQKLHDLVIGDVESIYRKLLDGGKVPENPQDLVCPSCGVNNIVTWDSKNKPCPKCGSPMYQNPNSTIRFLWD